MEGLEKDDTHRSYKLQVASPGSDPHDRYDEFLLALLRK